MEFSKVAKLTAGSPMFRISESPTIDSPEYFVYSQIDMQNDLININHGIKNNKIVRTFDEVNLTSAGDVVFSLISGTAAIICSVHAGYLLSQNYVVIEPGKHINREYLVYLLNESKYIKKQFWLGMQGSKVLKYTIRQLRELELLKFPTVERQQLIGSIYFKQLQLRAMQERKLEIEQKLILIQLEEINHHG